MKVLVTSFLLIFQYCNSQTIQEVLLKEFFTNCSSYISYQGVDYEQLLNSSNPPNLSEVTLNLHSQTSGRKVFSLPTSAREILRDSSFNITLPVVIYVHGFVDPIITSIPTVTNAFLNKGGWNVLSLDATKLVSFWYMYSVSAIRFIGEGLAVEILNLIRGGVPRNNIYIVSFSIGAHLAGFAGKKFKQISTFSLHRITGLDPAGPCFFNNSASARLDSSDADFVDVMHTGGGVWAMEKAIGHADYYFNDGKNQPLSIPGLSHHKVWEYYAESVLFPNNFQVAACSDWISFIIGGCFNNRRSLAGFPAPPTDRGTFFLRTKAFSPYGYAEKSVPSNFFNYLFP